MASIEQVETFFKKYGWIVSRQGEIITATVKVANQVQPLLAGIEHDWIILELPRYLLDPAPKNTFLFMTQLLLLNDQLQGAKLSLLDAESVCLSTGIPTINLSYEAFVVALETLIGFGDSLASAIQASLELDSSRGDQR